MLLTNWLKNIFHTKSIRAKNRRRFKPHAFLPAKSMATESLEDRTLLTFAFALAGTDVTFLGTSGNDSLVLREDLSGLLEFSTNGSAFSTDLGGGSTVAVALITSLTINGGNNNDMVDLSDLDGLAITAQITGGHGNDSYATGSADVEFLYSGNNNSSDTFTANGSGTSTILALNDNTVIGLASGFVNSVDVIDIDGMQNVRVDGTSGNDVLNFADVDFVGYDDSFQVYGGNNNDTITTSNSSAGVRYQGGHGNDHFIIGDADVTFLYTGNNNSSDSFSGNDGGQTSTILALSDNAVIGLASGFDNSVDVISDGGKSGVIVLGTGGNDTLNFEDVEFSSTLLFNSGNNHDTVTASLDRGHTITYDGAHGNDTLFLSLSDVEAQDPVVQAALADFFANYSTISPYTFGIDGPSSALDGITIQNFESILIPLVVSGAGDYRVVRNSYGPGTADDEVEIYRDGNLIANQLLDRTSEVRVIGATNSADSLEVDFSGGNPIPVNEVFFNGLGGSGSDELMITNGSHTDSIYNYTNAHDGSIILDDSVITYIGLEPITNTGTTVNAVFNLTNSANVATLTDNGATSSLTGTSFENTTFANPTNSLTINGSGGTDQLFMGGAYSVGLDLIIDAEVVTLNHDVTGASFSATGATSLSTGANDDIRATAGNIDITVSTGKIDVRGLLSAQNGGLGTITLNSASTVNVSGSVTTDGGDFTSSGTKSTLTAALP
ncbi:hypothetical protein [uncultured Gimesia sp.]|uniref:beta strand repeat-containing protein n=1 Tax=uncultured Gimesia sp. TaxID=1678688 RepID=UPI0030DAD138|tara:strand:- start:79400 stop:81568 length:2169 start_codon:yes stop_codon:yes gene_type:complete